MITYILLKDLPDSKVGTEYVIGSPSRPSSTERIWFYYPKSNKEPASDIVSARLPIQWVENNPEWFKKKEELVVVKRYLWVLNSDGVHISFPDEINELGKEIIDKIKIFNTKKYTEEDMRKCFNAARSPVTTEFKPVYMKFDDYFKTIQNAQL